MEFGSVVVIKVACRSERKGRGVDVRSTFADRFEEANDKALSVSNHREGVFRRAASALDDHEIRFLERLA